MQRDPRCDICYFMHVHLYGTNAAAKVPSRLACSSLRCCNSRANSYFSGSFSTRPKPTITPDAAFSAYSRCVLDSFPAVCRNCALISLARAIYRVNSRESGKENVGEEGDR